MNQFKLKDYKTKDTIAAIATFPSKAALGVVRISGKKALGITGEEVSLEQLMQEIPDMKKMLETI